MSRGKLITLEGIEGSGKSLQTGKLAEELRRRDLPVLQTFEPGATDFGRELRQVLLNSQGADRCAEAELLLYLADRVQHLREMVEPALEAGQVVVSDRYHDATLAYQGHARGLGFEWIDDLAGNLGIIEPDLTLLFDLETETGLRRARSRNHEKQAEDLGRFEDEDLSFHQAVREGYLRLAERHSDRMEVIDAGGTPEAVFSRVLEVLDRRL